MKINDRKELLLALLAATTEREISEILQSIGDRGEIGLDEPFGSMGLSWHAFGDKLSNLSTIGLASKPGKSMTERLTNAIDSVLEARKPIGVAEPSSSREAAEQWFGRPMTGPDTGLHQWIPLPTGMDRKYAIIMLGCGKESQATIDVVDYGIGIKPTDLPTTILSLQAANKISKWYLIGAFGQGGASTLAFAPYTLIISRSLSEPSTIAFTVIRVLASSDSYKEDIFAYLSEKTEDGILTVPSIIENEAIDLYSRFAKVNLPNLSQGTVVRHIAYQLPKLDGTLTSIPGNLYHYLHASLFDPLLPFRILDLRNSTSSKDELIRGSRTRLMRLRQKAARETEEDTGNELKHYRQMEYIVPAGTETPCIGIEYWVVFNYKKSKTGQPTLRPSSNELFVHPNKPIIGTLNGQNQGELTPAICREAGLNLTSKHIVIHIDCTLAPNTIRRKLFSTNREEFKDGEVLTSVTQELKRMLEEDEELSAIEKELTERITRREVDSANDEVKRTVTQLLRDAGFKESETGPTYEKGTQGQDQKVRREKKPGYKTKDPLPTLPFPEVTFFKIVSPALRFEIHKNDTEIILAETDADAEYYRKGLIGLRAEPDSLKIVSVSPLRGGRIRWRLQPNEDSEVGMKGRIIASLTKPNGQQIIDESLPFEILAPLEVPAKKSKNVVPPFEIIAIDPEKDPEDWGRVWPSLSEASNLQKLSSVSYKAMNLAGTVYVYYSTIFGPLADQINRLKSEPAKAALFEQHYKVWIAYHEILQLQSGDEASRINIPDPDETYDPQELIESLHEKECARTGEMIVRQARQFMELTLKAVGQEAVAAGGALD